MQAQTAYDQIAYDMDDAGLIFFEQSDIQNAVQNAYNKIVTLFGCIETTIRLTLTANVPYYDISVVEPRYYFTNEAFNLSNNRYLAFRTPDQLLNIRDDYELWPGQPIYISVVDSKKVGFFPYPTGPTEIAMKVKLIADTLVPQSVINIPPYAESMLFDMAKGELYEQAEEILKAAYSTNQFADTFGKTKRLSMGRALPNQVISFRGVDISAIKGAVNGI